MPFRTFELPQAWPYALCACASILIGVGFVLHLSLPHYWIDWEPGVIVVASLGLRRLFEKRQSLFLGSVIAIVLGLGALRTIGDVATLPLGPYQEVAEQASCTHPCVVQFAGYDDILINYVSKNDNIVLGPPHVRSSIVGTRFVDGTASLWIRPTFIVIDPNALHLHKKWTKNADYFEARAQRLGYERIPTKGRIKLWELMK